LISNTSPRVQRCPNIRQL